MDNGNLFAALRAAFPVDLDAVAIETGDGPGAPLAYAWRDLDRASAMIANLLGSLELPEGSRIAVQIEKSVEALMLYLAVLRSGHVYLPDRGALMHAFGAVHHVLRRNASERAAEAVLDLLAAKRAAR